MSNRFKVVHGGPYPHFITTSIVEWLPVFISGAYFETVLDSLSHLRENRGLLIHSFVIMPTHIHAILTASHDDLPAIIRDFKKFTARRIYELAKADGNDLYTWMFKRAAENEPRARFRVWQDNYHPEVVYSWEFFQQKANYIHNNPIRKGLCKDTNGWYYSSAAVFDGGESPIRIDWIDW